MIVNLKKMNLRSMIIKNMILIAILIMSLFWKNFIISIFVINIYFRLGLEITWVASDLNFDRPRHNFGSIDDSLDAFKIRLYTISTICTCFSDKN